MVLDRCHPAARHLAELGSAGSAHGLWRKRHRAGKGPTQQWTNLTLTDCSPQRCDFEPDWRPMRIIKPTALSLCCFGYTYRAIEHQFQASSTA
jgi:hypothetical protein